MSVHVVMIVLSLILIGVAACSLSVLHQRFGRAQVVRHVLRHRRVTAIRVPPRTGAQLDDGPVVPAEGAGTKAVPEAGP